MGTFLRNALPVALGGLLVTSAGVGCHPHWEPYADIKRLKTSERMYEVAMHPAEKERRLEYLSAMLEESVGTHPFKPLPQEFFALVRATEEDPQFNPLILGTIYWFLSDLTLDARLRGFAAHEAEAISGYRRIKPTEPLLLAEWDKHFPDAEREAWYRSHWSNATKPFFQRSNSPSHPFSQK